MIRSTPFLVLLIFVVGCSRPESQGGSNTKAAQGTPNITRDIRGDVYTEGELEYLSTLEDEVRRVRPRGLVRLERSSALDAGALLHARDMARRNYFSHDSPEGTTPSERVATAAPLAIVSEIKENLYYLETNNPLPPRQRAIEANKGLMDSPGHRENILHDRVTHLGLAVVRVDDGNLVREYTVQLFGRDLGVWSEGVPPRQWRTSSGAKSFPIRLHRDDIEFYIVDRDHPDRTHSLDRFNFTIGGLVPRLGPNNRSLQVPALGTGYYVLTARHRGEELYSPATWSFTVVD